MTSESAEPLVERSAIRSAADPCHPASSTNQRRNLSLRKARKLSRVFTEFSLLDPFASRKNAGSPKTSPQHAEFTAHGHNHTRTKSLEASPKKSVDGSPPLPTSSESHSSTREIKPATLHDNELIPNSESVEELPQLLTPSTSQLRPPKLPEMPPLFNSSRRNSRLAKMQRKSLDLRRTDELPLLNRSASLRISDMRRPAARNRWRDSSPDIRELPALPDYNHYLEVKRARKMTQLFGQELPPELIRIPDNGRKAGNFRHRSDSSSSLESVHSAPEETDGNSSFEEDVTDKPSPKLPRGEFQKRRRRITKLTQFFGVSHSEIASSVVNAKPGDRTTPSLEVEPPQEHAPAPTAIMEHEVGVKIVSRRRWGLGEDMRDVELSDAITRLRGLKSS